MMRKKKSLTKRASHKSKAQNTRKKPSKCEREIEGRKKILRAMIIKAN